jgi:hypothetical protein
MPSITLVDGTDLNSWANRRAAQEALPRLLRRLVHATGDRVVRLGFPAGEGVQLGGWDGVVEVEAGNDFVPAGTSAWEVGVNRDPRGKADNDYENRRTNPRGINPAESTFVFVTARRWAGKAEWATARQAEGLWQGVRAYDADDLETWLEGAPAVHIWLSILLGKHPEGAVDLENFWGDWTPVTRPAMTADLVLSGRREVVEQVHEWLRGSSLTLALRAESRDEALAVFAAGLHELPEEERSFYLNVVGLAAPAVLVLRPVVDQQQEPGGGEALDQALQEGLGLGVDPVEVLEHNQERLHLALAEQEALESVHGALATLRRVLRLPLRVLRSSTGTSRIARKAGSAGSKARSSVSSLPMTFSRTLRLSSRSSTWK